MKWTKEQESAIYTAGSDVLVAAAAGSGKTAVLVERIIQKLLNKENPVDIDALLVATFTNAAAEEMRTRVGAALEKALEEDPTSIHLKKQLSLLQKASISTLHAFCMDVVREYAYLIDIDPKFRIANEMEADLLEQETLDELFEKWYGFEGTERDLFYDVVDRFSSDRSDVDVESLILSLYTFAIQNPWPEQWLDDLAAVYHIPEDWNESHLPWLDIVKREVKREMDAIYQQLQMAKKIAMEADGPYHYIETLEADEKNISGGLERLNDWDELQIFMSDSTFVRLSGKRVECDVDKREKVKKLRDDYRKRWNEMKKKLFSRPLSLHVEDLRELYPTIKQLTERVKEFKHAFSERKREQAIVDFSDLEHYCLQILLDEHSTSDHIVPSPVAKSFKKRFKEVMVDEYQDTNLVQETILQLVSDQEGTGNMFMVGDVKQSIYRFRHAEPSLFIKKYNDFKDPNHAGVRIDLARNFRSREQVLIGANFLFKQILDEEMGEINYDDDAALIYANNIFDELPLDHPHPELLVIDREEQKEKEAEGEENYLELENAQLEARAYAQKIQAWIGNKGGAPLQVVDKKAAIQRDVKYRDIVILLRSMTWAPVIMDELKQQGIPVYAELSTGYFEAIEIKVMISLLKIIDNPRQDIPLVSVLRSPIVRLHEEELASIRLAKQHEDYYDALLTYERENNNKTSVKIKSFLTKLNHFRALARQGALSELIWEVYRKTGYYDFVGGMPGGRQRQANLRALYDRSRGYETTSFRGLFRFLRFIERMEERGDDLGAARALSDQEDVVRIMTIHKSKGLEFPVVIVGGMGRQFNLQDLNKKYLLDKDYGFAAKYIDPVKRITYPTLYYIALREEALRKQLAEEMRVLYVALTRAEEKVVMVANVPSFRKELENWQEILDHPHWVLPPYKRSDARSYLDWIGLSLARHSVAHHLHEEVIDVHSIHEQIANDPSTWELNVIHASEFEKMGETELIEDDELKEKIQSWDPLTLDNPGLDIEVNKRLSYHYPYKDAVRARAKQTVTEIKREKEIRDEYSDDQLVKSFQAPIIKRPNFMQKEKTISAAEKGTAVHTVMQHLPLNDILTAGEVQTYLEKLIAQEIITKEAAETIDIESIEKFYQSSISEKIRHGSKIYREIPFSLSLSAKEVYSTWESKVDEQVLIQGVIDLVMETKDGWIILDYKTDAIDQQVTEATKQMLVDRYAVQMDLYRKAIETIWKESIDEIYLYFFSKNLTIQMPHTVNMT